MPHLVLRSPDRPPRTIELRHGMTLGRHESNDIPLPDQKVSRRHAVFEHEGDRFRVRDLGSTHGVYKNGARIEASLLAPGDEIQIGESVLTFVETVTEGALLLEQPTEPPPLSLDDVASARLRALYEAAHALGDLADSDALAGRMLEALLRSLGAVTGLVGVSEPGGLRHIVRGGSPSSITLPPAVHTAVLKERKSVLLGQKDGAGRPTAMAAPLLFAGAVSGLVYVEAGRGAALDQGHLAFLGAYGHLLAAGLASAERFQRTAAVAEASAMESPVDAMLGDSPAMEKLRTDLRKIALARAHVHVHGESGTGKELCARAIHALSPRADGPFVTLNCAAIPETLIESEMFGYAKGAFTGAVRDKRGKLALAHRGTLFMDEIADLGVSAQAKLLRAIQEGEVQPLGSEAPVRVDVRVVSASHKDLAAEVEAGRFREDLYYRLYVGVIEVPPLRDRGDDILTLAERFLKEAALRLHKRISGFTPAARAALRRHDWPGNVRELQNEAERAAIASEGPLVDAHDLSARVEGSAPRSRAKPAPGTPPAAQAPAAKAPAAPSKTLAERFAELDPMEKELVKEALDEAKGNLSEAARLLGISRIMLVRRVEKLGR